MKIIAITVAVLLTSLSARADDASTIFTLYRNSVLNATMRMQVATFDAQDGNAAQRQAYNSGNCQQAQVLIQQQDGVGSTGMPSGGHLNGERG